MENSIVTLRVNNFFTLKNIDIKIKKINVFIGQQAAGKSLVVKLIYFFNSVFYSQIFIENVRKNKADLKKEFTEIFHLSGFNGNFEIEYRSDDYEISIIGNNKKFDINFNEVLKKFYKQKHSAFNKLIKSKKTDNSEDNLVMSNKESFELFHTKMLFREENNLNVHNAFIPAGRSFFVNVFSNIFNLLMDSKQINLDNTFLKFGASYQRIQNQWDDLTRIFKRKEIKQDALSFLVSASQKILNGSYVHDKNGGYLDQGEIKLKLHQTSSGQQEFFPVYLYLMDFILRGMSRKNLYIEEPEAHLYPTAQRTITELIIGLANKTKTEGVFISTHSPYIITILNILILAKQREVKLDEIDEDCLIDFNDVAAYHINVGNADDLLDIENNMIYTEKLDSVSEEYSEIIHKIYSTNNSY